MKNTYHVARYKLTGGGNSLYINHLHSQPTNSELPSGSERDFLHPQSGSTHLAGDGRCRLIVPNFIYQIIEQHLRFQGTLQTARFDFIDYKTYLIVEIVQNLS